MVTRITATQVPQVSNKLLLFLLCGLSFVIAPFGASPFENSKVLVAEGLILLLVILTLWQTWSSIGDHKPKVILLGAIAILSIVPAVLFHQSLSLFGNDFRLQGVFLLWLLLLLSWLVTRYSKVLISAKLAFLVLLATVVVTLLLPINEAGRYVGSLGEPNASAAVLLFLWPFIWLQAHKNQSSKRWLPAVPILIVLGSVTLLFHSYSALVGLALQLIFLALLKCKVTLVKSVTIVTVFLFLSLSLPFINQVSVYENRSDIWRAAVSAGWSQPLLGNGFGKIETAVHAAAVQMKLPVQYSYVDSSHNIFLDWWVQGGAVGLVLFVTLVSYTTYRLIQKKKILHLTLLLGLIAAMSFNPASIVGLVQLWWLIGEA